MTYENEGMRILDKTVSGATREQLEQLYSCLVDNQKCCVKIEEIKYRVAFINGQPELQTGFFSPEINSWVFATATHCYDKNGNTCKVSVATRVRELHKS